tara:strand:- start:71 stop:379 length:309 start_codon:yes stop_codon:yes gene_type:complete
MKIIARVKKVMDLQKGKSAKGEWKKQSVLVTQTGTDFKDELLIDFWNNNIKSLTIGKNYTFELILKSREYNEKYYTNVSCKYVSPYTDDEIDEDIDDNDNPF